MSGQPLQNHEQTTAEKKTAEKKQQLQTTCSGQPLLYLQETRTFTKNIFSTIAAIGTVPVSPVWCISTSSAPPNPIKPPLPLSATFSRDRRVVPTSSICRQGRCHGRRGCRLNSRTTRRRYRRGHSFGRVGNCCSFWRAGHRCSFRRAGNCSFFGKLETAAASLVELEIAVASLGLEIAAAFAGLETLGIVGATAEAPPSPPWWWSWRIMRAEKKNA